MVGEISRDCEARDRSDQQSAYLRDSRPRIHGAGFLCPDRAQTLIVA